MAATAPMHFASLRQPERAGVGATMWRVGHEVKRRRSGQARLVAMSASAYWHRGRPPLRRASIVMTFLVMTSSACDPEPPTEIGAGSPDGTSVEVYIRACEEVSAIHLVPPDKLATLNYDDASEVAVWQVDADVPTIIERVVVGGPIPDGFREVVALPEGTVVQGLEVIVFFGADRSNADIVELSNIPSSGDRVIDRLGAEHPVDDFLDACG